MMPRRSPNRVNIEADVVEDPVIRYCKQVAITALFIVFFVTAIAVFGMCVAYFFVKDREAYRTYCLPILYAGFSFVILFAVIFLLWQSDSRAVRNDLRRYCRNFRRIISLIPMPAFYTGYLRGRHPHRRIRVNTISVRPEPTPSYAVADCSVQIETPSPIRPLEPLHPPLDRSQICGTDSFYNFVNSHSAHPNMNIHHRD